MMPLPSSVRSMTTASSSLTSSVENSISNVRPCLSGSNDSGAMLTSTAAPVLIFKALSTHPLREFHAKPLNVASYGPYVHASLSASLFERPMARRESSSRLVISSICTAEASMFASISTVTSPFLTRSLAAPDTMGVNVTVSELPFISDFCPMAYSLPPLTSAMLTSDRPPDGSKAANVTS